MFHSISLNVFHCINSIAQICSNVSNHVCLHCTSIANPFASSNINKKMNNEIRRKSETEPKFHFKLLLWINGIFNKLKLSHRCIKITSQNDSMFELIWYFISLNTYCIYLIFRVCRRYPCPLAIQSYYIQMLSCELIECYS